mgnify:CR=1 FL=1
MTKTRHLRKSIQTILEVITFIIVSFFCMLADFSLSFVPVLLVLIAIVVINTLILSNYGKY